MPCPECPDAPALTYSGLEPRPGGFAMIYVCDACGYEEAYDADEEDLRDAEYR